MDLLYNPISLAIVSIIILIYSAILHEIAHGFVADRLGDPTARLSGRLTLNPKNHIDPFMSVLLPFLLILSGSPIIFGAAKPVPVDPFNLKEGRKDMAIVSLAGPLTNILIAVFFSFFVRFFPLPPLFNIFFIKILELNLLLAIFNLLPVPPLDGSKIFALLLPEKQANAFLSIGNLGIAIIFFLLLFQLGDFSLQNFLAHLLSFLESLLLP